MEYKGFENSSIFEKSHVYQMDCMEALRQTPDNYYDLSLCDPPYGLNMAKERPRKDGRFAHNKPRTWDEKIPDQSYFDELFRISKNQIIWGGNYFPLPPTQSFIFWYKQNPVDNFSDGELAWISHKRPAKCFDYRYYGNLEGKSSAVEKIHISQKPVALYDWIYKAYLPDGGKVIDTHLGSGSNRISADKRGNIDFTGFEIDKDYFEAQEKRWRDYKSQLTILF